jgi:catechol 2,3-dioxygenase
VRLTVADLERARAFYIDTLGFAILEQRDGQLHLGAPNGPTVIVLDELPGARPKPPRTTGRYHFANLLPSRADLGRVILLTCPQMP